VLDGRLGSVADEGNSDLEDELGDFEMIENEAIRGRRKAYKPHQMF